MTETNGKWTAADIPDQAGRTVMVTGANSGLGLQTAKELAGAGATVLMACRNMDKAQPPGDEIAAIHPDAQLEIVSARPRRPRLGRAAAAEVSARPGLGRPDQQRRRDGAAPEEDQGRVRASVRHEPPRPLRPDGRADREAARRRGPQGRQRQQHGPPGGEDGLRRPELAKGYSRWPAYGRSKLANLLFTLELARRAEAAGTDLIAAASHPGFAATNLQTAGIGLGTVGTLLKPVMKVGNLIFAQSDAMGALPSLYAATAAGVEGDDYFGPDGVGEQRGHPKRVGRTGRAADGEDARRLWEASEELTGVTFGPLDLVPA